MGFNPSREPLAKEPLLRPALRLICAALLLFCTFGRQTALGQSSAALEARLLPGMIITGTVGGVYVVQSSPDVARSNLWTSLAFVQLRSTNELFVDVRSPAQGYLFYRALAQVAPTNMVFIRPGAFVLGSPTNEIGRLPDEGPQTSVTITRGFWVGQYEVTQAEYLAVAGSNPSQFSGDLRRPVESVSWSDATNYCARLTQQEMAAGRIPAGSCYRLPTEAEWEYAARAGSSTRFSQGEDLELTNLTNYAWFAGNSSVTTHPVGQKLPNAWGLYDTEGNVWEWCSDWKGPYSGAFEIDPQGALSSPIGHKIIRGGAWDGFESDCRSAKRMGFGVSPFLTDSTLGFRIVLATR